MIRLRSYDATPPGGYPYEQMEGIHQRFPSVPIIEDQAKTVATFRKANGLPRASVREALEDVDAYQCQRLGGMSPFCVDTEATGVALGQTSPLLAPPCASCGAPIT